MSARHIALAIAITGIWGLNFVVVKAGLNSFPPLLFTSLRFMVAASPALLFVNRNGVPWRWILLLGLSMGLAMYAPVFIAMDMGFPAGLASLLVQIHVIFSLILSAVFLRDKTSFGQWAGVGIAFGGIALLTGTVQGVNGAIGLLLVIGSALGWGTTTVLIKAAGNIDTVRLFVWTSLIPPLPLLGLSLALEEGQWQAISNIGWSEVGVLCYAGLLSTIVGSGLWAGLLRHYPVSSVAPFGLLVPIFGMLASAVFLGESYSGAKLVASGLILMRLSP